MTDTIEIAGLDGGRPWSAFGHNFALGRVQIGTRDTQGHIRLSDAWANRGDENTEVLYVRHLEIGPASSLELDGMTLYTLEYTNDGGALLPGPTGQLVEVGPIQHLGADGLTADYDPLGGDLLGPPLLSVTGPADVLVESALQQMTHNTAAVTLTGNLAEERSENGIAAGLFNNLVLDIIDAASDVLASGAVGEMELREPADGSGGLTGTALMTVTDSVLREGFALGYGDTMEVELRITGVNLDNFRSAFSGSAAVDLIPIPEPATLALLAAGSVLLLRRRKC